MDDAREVRMHPLDYLLILRRRMRWVVIPAVVVLILGVAVTFLLPVKYRSSVTVAISGGTLSADVAHPIDRDERIRAFTQQLVGPSVLNKVAQLEHVTPATPTESDVLALRQRIAVSVPQPVPGTEPGQVDTFIVSYADSTAERARRVAQRLADVFVDDTSRARQTRAEDTSDFLAARLREKQDQLDTLDAKLTAARAKNMGRLPEQTAANVQMVTTLRQQLDSTTTQLRGEQDRLHGTEQQITMFEQQAGELSPNQAPSTPQQQVLQLEQQLAGARLKYTENYPDVKDLEDQLARARKAAAAEQSLPPQQRQASLNMNPAYRSLLADRQQTNLHIRDLQRTIAQTNSQIGWYESRLSGAPLVEQQINSLVQDRELVKKQYDDLSNKLQTARLQEDSERKRGSEHFRVLYPATLPLQPYEPNRQRLLLMTLAAALFIGVGAGIGREYMDQSIHDARALQQQFDVPVLGEIPHIKRVA